MNIHDPDLRRRDLSGVFIISFAALALEVLQMRIFAFVLWHHLAFLVISIALLGFGAAGAVLSSFTRLREASTGRSMAAAALLFSAAALSSALSLALKPVDIFDQVGLFEALRVGLYYLVFALPYFFAGYILALAFARAGRRAGLLYAVNLSGSGLGCFFIFGTLAPLGAEGSLLLVSALGCAAALLCARGPTLRWIAGGGAAVLLLAAPFAHRMPSFQPAGSKSMARALDRPEMEVLFTNWTPLCRIDVCSPATARNRMVFQDGDAPSILPNSRSPIPSGDIRHLAYLLLDEPKVLIIGVGGGPDARAAVQNGARGIDCVDINPVMLDLCRDPAFNAMAGVLTRRGDVRFHAAEGRFFVRRSEAVYDLIQMTGVDTYTALSSGAYVLSESYLYTTEAFHDYLDHLTERGVLSIIRFAFPAPRETLRIVVMACKALAERGAREPWMHVAVLRRDREAFTEHTSFGAVLIRKSPFTGEELAHLGSFADAHGFRREYLPGETESFTQEELRRLQQLVQENPSFQDYPVDEKGRNPYQSFAAALEEGREEEFLQAYPYDVRPVHDLAPFFFNQHRLSSLWRWILGGSAGRTGEGDVPWLAMTTLFQTRPLGLILLFLTLLQMTVLVALLFFAPLYFFRKQGLRTGGVTPALGYFLCLGLGYIFLMISFMQRFSLILGHPSYSISVTMAAFLIGSGLGSLLSGRFRLTSSRKVIAGVAGVLLLMTCAVHFGLPSITEVVLPRAIGVRILFCVSLVSPMAFVMGMCFPLGVRILDRKNQALIPWAYGVNSGATVLGSVVVAGLAMALGFDAVQWIAAALYVAAALCMASLSAAVLKPGA